MSSPRALQGGVKHSPGAGQLTGGNATPWLRPGQVYTCARQNAKHSLSSNIVMPRTVTVKINSALAANNTTSWYYRNLLPMFKARKIKLALKRQNKL